MPESVIDATIVAFSNGDLRQMRATSVLAARVAVLSDVLEERTRVRVNSKLLKEYADHVREIRNDVIQAFIELLDTRGYIHVNGNSLRRQRWAEAKQLGWPSHDQHLLAAAIDGADCTIFVTEKRHADCSKGVHRAFGINIRRLA